jgi:hypothetical protein
MSPTFSSTRQALGFLLIVIVILLSPLLLGHRGLPSREQIYASLPWRIGSYPYIQQQIFQRSGDIDIVFMGSSHIGAGIDPRYVARQLSKKLGRPAIVVSLYWGSAGFDALYFIARDLLEHRKVHMLVFYDDEGTNTPQVEAWRLIRFGDDAHVLTGLPLRLKIAYYYGAILGMPRNLLNFLRPSLPANQSPNLKRAVFKPPPGWLGAEGADEAQPVEEIPELPSATGAKAADVLVYSEATAPDFAFDRHPAAPLQIYFAKKLLTLAHDHGTKLVCLNLPVLANSRSRVINQSRVWPDVLQTDVPLIGIPPATLFGGMTDDTVHSLFGDTVHFNGTGRAYFTRVVTPKLLQVYDETKP